MAKRYSKNTYFSRNSNVVDDNMEVLPYQRLSVGILKQAADDLIACYLKEDEIGAKELEKWFVSQWAQWLSNNTGEMIIEKAKYYASKKRKD